MTSLEDIERIQQALTAAEDEAGAQAVAREGVDLTATLLRKNHDYGNSGLHRPCLAPQVDALTALQCRMSDKISRLQTLIGGTEPQVPESTPDTMRDLAGYCILWLVKYEEMYGTD